MPRLLIALHNNTWVLVPLERLLAPLHVDNSHNEELSGKLNMKELVAMIPKETLRMMTITLMVGFGLDGIPRFFLYPLLV